ncbi:MAG: YggT family protein [Actinomycetes bacterium]
MALFFSILWLLATIYFVLLIGRLVLDWVQVFSREWTPRGVILVIAEIVYSATDPPLNALRRVIRPVRIGPIAIDLAFLIVFVGVVILRQVFGALAASSA